MYRYCYTILHSLPLFNNKTEYGTPPYSAPTENKNASEIAQWQLSQISAESAPG